MDNRKSVRVRQRILAIFLPITAVLYVSCEALDPRGTDQAPVKRSLIAYDH
jgi:hypothetical protein